MGRPFFSVVIPTKNRSFLVPYAIQSVLRQSFVDYEIILVDNDDTEKTREVVAGFRDPRIRYFRTGNLSMPDNWEFGCSRAEGQYITILEDKAALKTRSLEMIYAAVRHDHSEVVVWLTDLFIDTDPKPTIRRSRGTGRVRVLSSDEILQSFINSTRSSSSRMLPRGLNSCIHQKLVRKIQDGPMGRLCAGVSPDYTMAFLQLAYSDHIAHIDDSLVVIGGYSYSNGRSFKLKGDTARRFVNELGGDENIFYDHVPVKAMIIGNLLYNDFMRVRSVVGGRLTKYILNLTHYFVECYSDIQSSKALGVNMASEERAWSKALSQQSESIRTAVNYELRSGAFSHQIRAYARLKNLGRRLGLDKLQKLIRHNYDGQERPNAVTPSSFSNVLEYVEWEDRENSSAISL